MLNTIEGLLATGAIIGLLIAFIAWRERIGCALLAAIPIFMLIYTYWWQTQHPESLRSTSGLDFIFGPLWPSLGAIAGYLIGRIIQAVMLR